jgi:hypothetical protein
VRPSFVGGLAVSSASLLAAALAPAMLTAGPVIDRAEVSDLPRT